MSKKLTLDLGYKERLKQELNVYYAELAVGLFPRHHIDFRTNQVRVGTNGSLSIFEDGKWYSHEHNVGDYDLLSLIQWNLDCDFKEAISWAKSFLDDLPVIDEHDYTISKKVPPSLEERIAYAKTHWKNRQRINNTLAEKYLRNRSIRNIPSYTSRKLGFLPSHKHTVSNQYLPCLIAKVQNEKGGFAGIQRIYLDNKGQKAKCTPNKMRLGSAEGAAIRLSPISPHIHVCEGLEDALSLQMMIPDSAVWCGMGGSIENMVFPSSVEEVTIAADNDLAGDRYANNLARRLLREGRLVNFIHPHKGFKDFNQQLKELPL